MILDARVPVTCDGKGCGSVIEIEPEFKYPNYSGKGGSYDTSDSAIEEKLVAEEWIVIDGKHYCCEECKPESDSE